MAVDFALCMLAAADGRPAIRFYGWDPPCISLGFNQRAEEIDLDRCREAGIDVVRRPTGGRAVYHDREITYAVVIPNTDPLFSESTSQIYHRISGGLVSGLRALGVGAVLEKRRLDLSSHYRNEDSVSCFSAAARHEITVGGKKLAGSAQRRLAEGVLQHGSILLGENQHRLADFLKLDASGAGRLKGFLNAQTVSITEAAGREVTFEEAAAALAAGFEQLPAVLQPCGLTREEAEAAEAARSRFAVLTAGPMRSKT